MTEPEPSDVPGAVHDDTASRWIVTILLALYVISRFVPSAWIENDLWFLAGIVALPWWCFCVFLVLAIAVSGQSFPPIAYRRFQEIATFCAAGIVFFVFRDRLYAVGDAPVIQPRIEALIFDSAPHTPLWNALSRWFVTGLYHRFAVDPVTAYSALVALVCAIGLMSAVRWSRLYPETKHFFGLLLAGQGAQICFGQLEVYAMGYWCEVFYLLHAWRCLQERRDWFGVALWFGLTVVTGGWNLFLFLSFVVVVFVLLRNPKPDSPRIVQLCILGTGVIIPILAVGGPQVVWHALLDRTDSGFTVFNPPPPEMSVWLPWTWPHLTGFINLVLALGMPMLVWWFVVPRVKTEKREWNSYQFLFLLAVIVPTVLLVLLWYPWYGYRRDLDLFTFAIPALAYGAIKPIKTESVGVHSRWIRTAVLMSVLPTVAVITVNAGVWRDDWPGQGIRHIARLVSPSKEQSWIESVQQSPRLFTVLDEAIQSRPNDIVELIRNIDAGWLSWLSYQTPSDLDRAGWAVDLQLSANGDALVLDRWGRILCIGASNREFVASYPHPSPAIHFIALTDCPDGTFALAVSDGRVFKLNLNVPGSWERVALPFTASDFPPYLRAIDIGYDEKQHSIVVLDNEGRLHFVPGGGTLEPREIHTNVGRRLLLKPNSTDRWCDGWCYLTRLGELNPIHVAVDPSWKSPFLHPVIMDGCIVSGGRGILLLDVVGGVHRLGETPEIEHFYPLPLIGRFVRMVQSRDGNSLVVLDRAYRVVRLQIHNPDES